MIKIIRNPKTQDELPGFFPCPSNPPMKCMNDACLSVGYVCYLYKGIRREFWK